MLLVIIEAQKYKTTKNKQKHLIHNWNHAGFNDVGTKLALGCYAATVSTMFGTVSAGLSRNLKMVCFVEQFEYLIFLNIS
jgi:hypothetical protein